MAYTKNVKKAVDVLDSQNIDKIDNKDKIIAFIELDDDILHSTQIRKLNELNVKYWVSVNVITHKLTISVYKH